MKKIWRMMACVMALAAGRALAQETLPANVQVNKEVVYAQGQGGDLKLDVYAPQPPLQDKEFVGFPVIVRISPQREAPSGVALELLGKGFALVYVAYLPQGTKDETEFTHFPADEWAVKAAIRWVRGEAGKNLFDANRIALWGADDGASLAALAAVTADQKDLNGALGDHPDVSNYVRAVCLFGGTTDWRNAELYGEEAVNIPGSAAYQLFGGNPKEFPEDARKASAVNYIRPSSPATLMVTLASDSNRAMHLIYAETLRRAGVASALYEEPPGSGSGVGGRAVDEAKLDQTIVAFFSDTLAASPASTQSATQPATQTAATQQDEIQKLISAGLFKQARRIIEEQIALAANAKEREPWLKMIRQLAERQQEPALKQLQEAMKANPNQNGGSIQWTIREVLTDPDHIGEYQVEASASPQEFDMRAAALTVEETLNDAILKKDWTAADQQAANLRNMMANGIADVATTYEILNRYSHVRGHPEELWPANTKPVSFASDFGQDMYGHWMEIKAGGVLVHFRYIAPGKYFRGSSVTEWGRLPGEPLQEQTEIKQGFWMQETLVTQALWEGELGVSENHAHFRGPNLPAENLSYAHAVNFLDKIGLGARLPSREEWEYACRAGSPLPYAGTGRLSDMAWFWDEKREGGASDQIRILHELETDQSHVVRSTHDVKTKLPNRWGLYDMQGEVWEWCDGTSPDRPHDFHVARGGSWISIPQNCRAAREAWFSTEQESWNLGMRIVIPSEPQ